MTKLVLGSSSPFRADILEKLGMPFATCAPEVDESALQDETAAMRVSRLAEAKARAVAEQFPNSLIIGSDQLATVDGQILGKPGNRENAIAQLTAASGRSVIFHTGLCLLNTATNVAQVSCEPFTVNFRDLTEQQIARYVDREQPFQCAGSFKSEGYGITLFSSLQGDDPNTLIGLPLIRLVDMLGKEGFELP